jgi:Ca-activated chloride channel family protein
MMFNSQIFDNSRPDGISVLEVIAESSAQGGRLFVPLQRTDLAGEITGPLATLRLAQVFAYTHAQCDHTLEAVYRFPLPGDAAVTDVCVRFGDIEIRAELKERKAAENSYAEAVRTGRQAALATRESPDVFTLRIAGLQPDQKVTVETGYVQLARTEGLNWTLRLPLTTSPRYVRADEAASPHAKGQPLLLMRDPGHRFTLDLKFSGCEQVASPTHQLATTALQPQDLLVRLADGEVLPDRDCVLTWRPLVEQAQPGLNVWLHDDRQSEHIYFLAQLAPPAAIPAATVPREVVLLVDHSGSMEGAKWQAADWAVMKFLRDLNEQDAFALGLFHNSPRWFKPHTLQPATPQTIEQAIRFLQQHRDSGGTELGVALEQALHHAPLPGERARHLVIVTDAEVTDAGRILRLAHAEARKERRRRISVICIDAAPNSFLVNELTERGGGIAKFLTSNPNEEDIATALDDTLESFAQPILVDLRLEIDRQGAQAAAHNVTAGRHPGTTAIDIGDLPRGQAVWVAGRAPRNGSDALTFTVASGGRDVASYRVDLSQQGASRPALKALFGARRVLTLEMLLTAHHDREEVDTILKRLGYDPTAVWKDGKEQPSTVYSENELATTQERLNRLLCRQALEFGLASSATAFVAQRTEAGHTVEAIIAVPNALPTGWSDSFAGGSGQSFARFRRLSSAPMSPSAATPVSFDFEVRDALACSAQPEDVEFLDFVAPESAPAQAMADVVEESGMSVPLPADQRPSPARTLREKFMVMTQRAERGAVPTQPVRRQTPQYVGVPNLVGQQAALFDTSRREDAAKLPKSALFTGIAVQFPDGAPDPARLGSDVMLLLFIDDMAAPRARVGMADLIRQGGSRPLNLQRGNGQTVKLVLEDPAGIMVTDQIKIAVMLSY